MEEDDAATRALPEWVRLEYVPSPPFSQHSASRLVTEIDEKRIRGG